MVHLAQMRQDTAFAHASVCTKPTKLPNVRQLLVEHKEKLIFQCLIIHESLPTGLRSNVTCFFELGKLIRSAEFTGPKEHACEEQHD